MAELGEQCGLPHDWRGASPLADAFDPERLTIAWVVALSVLFALLTLLLTLLMLLFVGGALLLLLTRVLHGRRYVAIIRLCNNGMLCI